MAKALTSDQFTGTILVAFVAAAALCAVLTAANFAIYTHLVLRLRMRVVAVMLATVVALASCVAAATGFVALVDFALNRSANAESPVLVFRIFYDPGVAIKLALLSVVPLTWAILVSIRRARKRKTA